MPDAPADGLPRISGALARHLLTLLPADRPHGRADLARLPIPVAHYLGGVLDRHLAREAALPDSGWFDAEAEAVQAAARAWHAATRDTARFPADAWAEAVGDAAGQVLGYLVEPVETLTERVFAGEEGPLPLEAVRARMATFSPYPYLREIAEGYFARKGVEAVGRDDFERLLRRIDRRMVSPFGPPDWLALLEPLFELLRPLPDGGRVPAPLLRRFFAAKGYDDLARALDPSASSGQAADAYDADALRDTLTAALPDLDEVGLDEVEPAPPGVDAAGTPAAPVPEAEAPEPMPEEAPEPEAPEPEEPEEDEVPVAAPEPAPAPRRPEPDEEPEADEPEADEPEPLWLRLARRREEAAPPEPAPAPAPEAPAARDPEPEAEAEPLWKRFAAGTAEAPASGAPARRAEPLARLETRVLGPSATERRDWYVAHLTGGSEADYRAVLEQLDAAPSWTAASQVIAREVFRKHQVNIYSDAAVAFTDAAEARFTRR